MTQAMAAPFTSSRSMRLNTVRKHLEIPLPIRRERADAAGPDAELRAPV